jgi:1-acyl-sn-glycerol-3-phosphate acyltransferase
MLYHLPHPIKGTLAIISYSLNTIVVCIPIIIVAIFKLLIPLQPWRNFCTSIIMWLANAWVSFNSFSMQKLNRINFHITGNLDVKNDDWYLVIANHQSWVDIVAMQHVLHKKIPFLKFFLKQELIYVPFLGVAWWALDFPFMKRFSKSKLRKKPHLKGKDIEATKKACEKFKTLPISVVNFVEGTRYQKEKSIQQSSPYQHLLKPKAGGIGYVMSLLGEQIHTIVDLTISYPDHQGNYWKFLSGQIHDIYIHVELIPVTDQLRGNYIDNKKFRSFFQRWLTDLWVKKDQSISQHRQQKP